MQNSESEYVFTYNTYQNRVLVVPKNEFEKPDIENAYTLIIIRGKDIPIKIIEEVANLEYKINDIKIKIEDFKKRLISPNKKYQVNKEIKILLKKLEEKQQLLSKLMNENEIRLKRTQVNSEDLMHARDDIIKQIQQEFQYKFIIMEEKYNQIYGGNISYNEQYRMIYSAQLYIIQGSGDDEKIYRIPSIGIKKIEFNSAYDALYYEFLTHQYIVEYLRIGKTIDRIERSLFNEIQKVCQSGYFYDKSDRIEQLKKTYRKRYEEIIENFQKKYRVNFNMLCFVRDNTLGQIYTFGPNIDSFLSRLDYEKKVAVIHQILSANNGNYIVDKSFQPIIFVSPESQLLDSEYKNGEVPKKSIERIGKTIVCMGNKLPRVKLIARRPKKPKKI